MNQLSLNLKCKPTDAIARSSCCSASLLWTSYNPEMVKGKTDHWTCSACDQPCRPNRPVKLKRWKF